MNASKSGDVDKVLQYYAEDAELVTTDLPEGIHGKEAIRKVMQDMNRMFGDMSMQATSTVREADKVATIWRVQGVNTGEIEVAPGKSIPATGKRVDYQIANFLTLDRNGKIKKDVAIFDNASLMQQLGVPPETWIESELQSGSRGASTTPPRRR